MIHDWKFKVRNSTYALQSGHTYSVLLIQNLYIQTVYKELITTIVTFGSHFYALHKRTNQISQLKFTEKLPKTPEIFSDFLE